MCCEMILDNKNVYSPPNVIIRSPVNAQRAVIDEGCQALYDDHLHGASICVPVTLHCLAR